MHVFEFDEVEQGLWWGYLCPQSVEEVAGILPTYAKDRICIYGFDRCWDYDLDQPPPTLEETARRQGLSPLVPDRDVIVIRTTELRALLADVGHYNLSLLDMPAEADEDRALDCVLKALDIDWRKGESVLQSLCHSDVFLSSHDDCYLHVESRHLAHLRDHLRCLLKDYVSSWFEVPIPLPPTDIVDEYLARHRDLIILDDRTEYVRGILKARLSSEPFSREVMTYPVSARIVFDVAAGLWCFESAD